MNQEGPQSLFELTGDALFSLAVPAAFAVVAAPIVSRQPHNTIGWLLLVPVGLGVVVGPMQDYLERLAPSAPAPTLLLLLMTWFSGWSWLLLIFPLTAEMLRVVDETLQPEFVVLWLKETPNIERRT